ncbi:MAG TPA: Na+ dependent nucleoside transporter [Bacteroidetes bacterium]|nr:Na+ dependent nucleoside transporter [Bacteroidota bacterium]
MKMLKKYSGLFFVIFLLFLFNNPVLAQEVTSDPSTSHLIPSEGFNFISFLRGLLGMAVVLGIAYLFSANRKGINWKTVRVGLTIQIILAIGILMGDKIGFNIPSIDLGFWQINRIDLRIIRLIFEFGGSIFVKILDFTRVGSEFLFGGLMNVNSAGFIFALQVLPTIIFFSALTSLLFYLGWIQIVVKGMAKVLTKMMHVSGREALSVTGNIFLGQTEAPLMIKAYLEKMTKSEILLVMIGGMATVAGGVLAAYISFLGGDDPVERLKFAKHLLAASVMAAPGAIVISKMLFPEKGIVPEESDVEMEDIGSNILDAISNGTTQGLKLAANVAAMLLVFLAFIAMMNYVFSGIGGFIGLNDLMAKYTPYNEFSLESMLGLIFAPLMWLLGVVKEDIMVMGQLLGIKLVASEFVAYTQLADLKQVTSTPHLMYEKSVIMATYMLCGFANFASIGIQIGGIGSLAPGQRTQLAKFGMMALLGGSLASLLSATFVGMIMG